MAGPWDKDNPPRVVPRVLVPSSAAMGAVASDAPVEPAPPAVEAASPVAAPPVNAIVHTDFLTAQRANRRATLMLLAILTLVAGLFGYVIGWALEAWSGDNNYNSTIFFLSGFGILAAVVLMGISVVWSGISLAFGDKMILSVAGAKEVTQEQEPVLHNVVEEMAIASGMPKPRVFVMEVDALNAFATGMSPKHSA